MNHLQNGVLQLIAAAVTESHRDIPTDLDWAEAATLGHRHKILPLLYYGVLQTGAVVPPDILQALQVRTFRQVVVSQNQQIALDALFAAFDAAGIAYMPLKGTLLKPLYPKSEMRSMGDADVLIQLDQYDRIKEILPTLGLTEGAESDHELIWRSPVLYLELHKRLIPSYNKDYFAYYGNGWQLAKVCEGSRYGMTDEDQLIYLFTHFAKHYRDGGIGIKHMVDLWVYRRHKPDLDEAYIAKELKSLQLYTFYTHICRTLAVWFEGAEADAHTDLITDFVFGSGEFGLHQNHVLSDGVKLSQSGGNAKTRKAIQLVFLPYPNMCEKYPWLRKVPFLLPVMWVWRIATILLFKGDRIKKHKDNLDQMKAEDIQNFGDALHFVGLDFHFEE